ncbi:MAG: DUF5654 family protein [Patescibacteria group bacterium]|jgi:polyferredoxin
MEEKVTKLTKIKENTIKLEKEAKKQMYTYLVSAFGLIAGLAWNDAIKSLIESMFPLGTETIWAKFIYALVITLFVVLASAFFARLLHTNEEEKK